MAIERRPTGISTVRHQMSNGEKFRRNRRVFPPSHRNATTTTYPTTLHHGSRPLRPHDLDLLSHEPFTPTPETTSHIRRRFPVGPIKKTPSRFENILTNQNS